LVEGWWGVRGGGGVVSGWWGRSGAGRGGGVWGGFVGGRLGIEKSWGVGWGCEGGGWGVGREGGGFLRGSFSASPRMKRCR